MATSAGQLPQKKRSHVNIATVAMRNSLQRINARVALIFKSIIILLIVFLGFIKSKPC